jgi:hypothetical protein
LLERARHFTLLRQSRYDLRHAQFPDRSSRIWVRQRSVKDRVHDQNVRTVLLELCRHLSALPRSVQRSVSLHSSGMNPMIAGATALSHHNLRGRELHEGTQGRSRVPDGLRNLRGRCSDLPPLHPAIRATPGTAAAPMARWRNLRRGNFILHLPRFTSFDHLIGAGEQRRRHFETNCFCTLKIDGQFELDGGLDGKITRARPAKYAIDVTKCATK